MTTGTAPMTGQQCRSDRASEMLALRDGGMALAEIGRRYGISRERVRQVLKQHGRTGPAYHPCAWCGEPAAAAARYCGPRCRYLGYRQQHGLPPPERWAEERAARKQQRYDEMVALREQGYIIADIAAIVGCHPAYAGKVLADIAPARKRWL